MTKIKVGSCKHLLQKLIFLLFALGSLLPLSANALVITTNSTPATATAGATLRITANLSVRDTELCNSAELVLQLPSTLDAQYTDGSYNNAGNIVTWTIGDIQAGTSGSLSLTTSVRTPTISAIETVGVHCLRLHSPVQFS